MNIFFGPSFHIPIPIRTWCSIAQSNALRLSFPKPMSFPKKKLHKKKFSCFFDKNFLNFWKISVENEKKFGFQWVKKMVHLFDFEKLDGFGQLRRRAFDCAIERQILLGIGTRNLGILRFFPFDRKFTILHPYKFFPCV